jgi:hypothetical protein
MACVAMGRSGGDSTHGDPLQGSSDEHSIHDEGDHHLHVSIPERSEQSTRTRRVRRYLKEINGT